MAKIILLKFTFISCQFKMKLDPQQNNFISMCLFYGDSLQNCDHAQCQIVYTIKSLNQQSLFTQVANRHHQLEQENEAKSDSVSGVPDDHQSVGALKVEVPSLEHKLSSGKSQIHLERIDRLERQVRELRQLTSWMKDQLQRKGLLY